jgi:general secretion pathway protein G
MPQVPLDPWNNPYLIRNPATMSKDKVDLYSAGPDGQANTPDDIGNW